VVIGDPQRDKSEALLRSLGRFIQSLNGRYITATDVGTTDADMEVIGQETRFFTGLPESQGGSGGTSAATGLGLYMGMKACAKEVYGSDSLAGKRVMVQGVGKVGGYLMEHLAQEGAVLIVADVNQAAVQRAAEKHRAKIVPPDEVFEVDCDIFSPNALGPVLDDQTIPLLRCRIVCGGANNQLAEPRHGQMLAERGILYAPDYIVNAGGVINVAHEFEGYVREKAYAKVRAIYQTMERVIAIAKERGIPTSEAADRLAEERILAIRAIHRNYLPPKG
jgi:leucine dehydrogenase